MELGFFTRPLHPSWRPHDETLIEDRDAVVLADKLGYREAFVGEQLSGTDSIVTNANMFLASLVPITERIMLASYSNMPQIHPAIMALHAAQLDNILRGRYVLGITPGVLASDRELLEALDDDAVDRFFDGVDVMLRLWQSEPPYNVVGKRWRVSTERSFYPEIGCGYIHRPYQLPYPRIVAGLETQDENAAAGIAKRGFSPLSPPHVHPDNLVAQWLQYASAKIGADPGEWRVARSIFVTEDEKVAHDYAVRREDSPYRHFNAQTLATLNSIGEGSVMVGAGGSSDLDAALTIFGTVDQVVDQVLALRQKAGPFGTLLYNGVDWVDPALARKSMVLMAEQVMPRVNSALSGTAAVSELATSREV